MRIRFAIPDRHIDEGVLNAALETSTRANQRLLAAGEAPSIREAISGGVRWRPERFSDGEHFDLSSLVAQRGWGDCDDLAPWLAAEMRLRGDPRAAAIVRRSGPSRWHALVRTGAGELVDPSAWAGMKSRRDLRGTSIQSPMARPGEGAAAVLPLPRGWAGRTDLPLDGGQHVCGMSWGLTPEEALLLSARGAALAGEEHGLSPDELDGMGSLLAGLCGDVQEESTVGFLDSLLDAAGSVAKTVLPLASAAAPFIPGIGPIAAAALPAAGSLLSALTKGGGGGGGGGGAGPAPGGGGLPFPGGGPGGGAPSSLPAFGLPPARPGGSPMHGLALPGGGHVAYNPSQPGPIIVRF